MIDLSRYRIIDLSHELTPGERKRDGRYLHGDPLHGRPVEVQEYEAYNARMHAIQGHTHCGTHAEGAYKYAARIGRIKGVLSLPGSGNGTGSGVAKVAASLFAVCWTWNSLSCGHVPLAGVESCAVHLARTYFSAVARKWKVALIRVFEFSLREETCGSDGWRARGQTDSVEVAYPSGRGANGNGLGQCGDDLHLPATRRAFRHIDVENPCKQAGPGEAIT